MQHNGLIATIARRYLPLCDRATDMDDLLQAGAIGVMRAEATYNPDKGKWANWAGGYIATEMQAALGLRGKRVRAHRLAVSLDEPLSEGFTLSDTLPDASTDIEQQEDTAELTVTVRERVEAIGGDIIRLVDLEGKTIVQAAEATGMSYNAARDARNKGKRLLRADTSLKALAEAHGLTNWHYHRSLTAWRSDWMSATEILAFERIRNGL